MANLETFRPKNPEQLKNQVREVSQNWGSSITPPSINNEALQLPASELREKFPKRYEIYVNTLRRQRKNEAPNYSLYGRTLHTLNALDRYIENHHSNENGKTLWDYQMNVFEDLREYLEQGGTEGYIKLPTGSGKTVLFAEFAEATDLRTLIVVPTKLLVDQTDNMFKQFAENTETGKLYSDRKEYDKQVTITTYASFMQKVDEGKIDPEDYDLLILDEAHRALSNRRSDLARMFDRAIKLGFTATPKYTEDKQLRNLLSTEIHNMGIREAVELGALSPLSVYIARTDVDLSDIRIHASGDYVERDLERKINIVRRNMGAVELYQKMFDGLPAISYCVGINHAKELTKLFVENGVSADFVNGQDTRLEQQDKLERFRNGEIKVLCNADILIEGFDERSAAVCLNLRPTLSPVIAEQRAGRVLRPDPNNPDKHAYIVDFIDGDIDSGKHIAVSFAQIVEAAHIFRKSAWTSEAREGLGYPRYSDLEIEGIKVITVAEEILRLAYEMGGKSKEGWSSYMALSSRFRISESTISDIVHSLQEEHKDQIRILTDEQHGTREYVAPDLANMLGDIIKTLRKPDDWITYSKLAEEFDRGITIVIKTAEKYREEHPEWFRRYIGEGGHFNEHYSPELISALRRDLGIRQSAPEGWSTGTALGIALGRSQKYIKRLAKQHGQDHPEWFQNYEAKKGGSFEHYSPELVNTINQHIENAPTTEWTSQAALANIIHTKPRKLSKLTRELSKDHPEWIRTETVKNRQLEWYAPELVEQLKQSIGMYERPPEGWITATQAAVALGHGHNFSFIRRRVEKYREAHPEWFGKYKSVGRDVSEQYAPELIEALREELSKYEPAPNDWAQYPSLARQIGSSHRTVKTFAEGFRSEHPEWFREFLNAGGGISEYYSPKLINKIEERFRK